MGRKDLLINYETDSSRKIKRLWTKTMVKKGTVDFFTKQSGVRGKKGKIF